ncbi:hypothetical protein ACIBG8_11485 [Nonomuraea sp. NPDC050556]|uniref:hypothetical protein n=1 Tax=Nonomuraea sp. NPDC050556 TaxID=3364369 RepID=UPI0037A02280
MRRTEQRIVDISRPDELIRYAAAAQLIRLDEMNIPQNVVARATGIGTGNLSNCLNGSQTLTADKLEKLDQSIVALAPDMDYTGRLSSLGTRLRGLEGRIAPVAATPPGWTWEMLQEISDRKFEVLIQSSALLSMFLAVDKEPGRVRLLRGRYKDQLPDLVERLIHIGTAPPTPRNIDALVLVGSLAKYSFESTSKQLEEALLRLPIGFRVWRAITKLVQLTPMDSRLAEKLRPWIYILLVNFGEELRANSIYPGRSLDLELAIAVPRDWSPPGPDDWVKEFLLARAWNGEATIRERGTAAMGLWQRTFDGECRTPDRDEVEAELRRLIATFRQDGYRPDAAGGLHWIAATLEHVLYRDIPVCNEWPATSEPWRKVVADAADLLGRGVPKHLVQGTATLFEHALMQNAGVYRRQAIDTLVAGGLIEPVARALQYVLKQEKNEVWLRIRALFALGFLQHRDLNVAHILTDAFAEAYANLMSSHEPTRAQITEMHVVMFAIGDCFGARFGAKHAPQAALSIRAGISDFLRALVVSPQTRQPDRYPVARAAAYLLTVTARDRERPDVEDLSQELLRRLLDHPDEVTRRFAAWTLGFRFAPDGTVRPLVCAAQRSVVTA